MTPTVVLETISLQVHPDFNLRGLAVRNTLLRYNRKTAGEVGDASKRVSFHGKHISTCLFPLITIWLLVFVITVSCD